MQKVKILECGPRDGWQNLKQVLPTEEKLKYIDGLFACGLESVEITSFVSPKAIPQMVDAGEVARYCVEKYPDKELVALVPNFKGAELAKAAGLKNLTYVISVSESHNKANINRTHDQSFEELRCIRESFPELELCIGMATTFGCPFEGIPTLDKVLRFVERIHNSGVDTVYLADTIGIADPAQVRRTVQGIRENFPDMKLQVHIHDTRGMGLVNTLAVWTRCSPRWVVWADAPSRRAHRATPPLRTWSTCCSAWGTTPASTSTSCWRCPRSSTRRSTACTADTR